MEKEWLREGGSRMRGNYFRSGRDIYIKFNVAVIGRGIYRSYKTTKCARVDGQVGCYLPAIRQDESATRARAGRYFGSAE